MHDRMLSSAALTAALLRILELFRAARRRIFWFGISYCYKNYFYGTVSGIAHNCVKICSGVKWHRYATRSIVIPIWIRAYMHKLNAQISNKCSTKICQICSDCKDFGIFILVSFSCQKTLCVSMVARSFRYFAEI